MVETAVNAPLAHAEGVDGNRRLAAHRRHEAQPFAALGRIRGPAVDEDVRVVVVVVVGGGGGSFGFVLGPA